ncbi:MAG: hypothetical protein AAFX78_01765 [Cyanobacteria bacterium J06638_20]
MSKPLQYVIGAIALVFTGFLVYNTFTTSTTATPDTREATTDLQEAVDHLNETTSK